MKPLKQAASDAGITPTQFVSLTGFERRREDYERSLLAAQGDVVDALRYMLTSTSLRQLAVRLFVSPTYLSNVRNHRQIASPNLIVRVGEMLRRSRRTRKR
jgi:hypothetical protein